MKNHLKGIFMTTSQSTDEILDRKTAAIYLHICKTTLDRLDIPRTKIRRRVLYRKDILDKWLVENTETRTVRA
jgi:hypothetical protein